MSKDFDLVILGVGMAGVNAANKCASAGWKVAVVDQETKKILFGQGAPERDDDN